MRAQHQQTNTLSPLAPLVAWLQDVANDIPRGKRIGVTLGLYLGALFIALVFQDLGIVLELTGAVSGSFLAYILPSSMYLCVHSKELLSILQQIGSNSNPLCFCCIKLFDISILENTSEATDYQSSDEDAPVEITLDSGADSTFFARFKSKVLLLRPFWLR